MKKAIMPGFLLFFLLSFDTSVTWAQEMDHTGISSTEECFECHSKSNLQITQKKI